MDSSGKKPGMSPAKDPHPSRAKVSEISRLTENHNPNLSGGSPLQKPGNSPVIKSAKSKKLAAKNPFPIVSPHRKIQERKFVVAKKKSRTVAPSIPCKCQEKMGINLQKCPCVAYENLRASQEEFFRSRSSIGDHHDSDETKNCTIAESEEEEELEKEERNFRQNEGGSEDKAMEGKSCSTDEPSNQDPEEHELSSEVGSSKIKRRRDELLEEARNSIPEPGSGRVMHLVKAFERLLSIPSSKDPNGKGDDSAGNQKGLKWALPGLQPKVPETQDTSSSRVSSSFDSSQGSFSFTSKASDGGHRSRRHSSESSGSFGGRKWKQKKQLKVTSQKPFKLRTEQRGRFKEEEFLKKVQEMLIEEEKLRIPIAQGLPWTTDEPECLAKPPVKENTKPIDLKLHSDLRAMDRAEFDHYVAEKLSLIEQYRMERERQQQLAEEEEIKRLRRELVPKAQPMPYFDRPFIPKRSLKNPTIPREPKFHIPHHKKIKCMSWNDINIYTHQL